MLENPETSDIEGIVYSVDITEEKRNEKIFRIISDEEYDYVALLHLGDRKMQFLNLSPRLLPKYHENLGNMKLIEYDKVREFGLATWIAEEDRDFYLKNSAIDVITRELDASGHFELSVSGHYTGQPDIFMPVMDGYETTKMIRSLDRADAKTVPIIAMTADAFSEDVRKCLDAGMDGHVPKPVEPDLLFSTLISKMKERK